jgi:hypothetical protein
MARLAVGPFRAPLRFGTHSLAWLAAFATLCVLALWRHPYHPSRGFGMYSVSGIKQKTYFYFTLILSHAIH